MSGKTPVFKLLLLLLLLLLLILLLLLATYFQLSQQKLLQNNVKPIHVSHNYSFKTTKNTLKTDQTLLPD